MEDIGYLLFKEVLGMADYPAGPFSGVILKDLVMFFLIPSIFIILVIYMMLGRLFYPATQRGLRLLVGIGAYLFIVFGGYFGVFAELAGPYFIILIFIMGLLYMFLELFRVKPVPAAGGHGLAAGGFGSGGGNLAQELIEKQVGLDEMCKARDAARRHSDTRGIVRLEESIGRLSSEVKILQAQIKHNPAAQIEYQALKLRYRVK